MTYRTRAGAIALGLSLSLAACHSASQAPGMDAKDLSDDRGARAGRFPSPADNAADNAAVTNDTGPADNSLTMKGNQ